MRPIAGNPLSATATLIDELNAGLRWRSVPNAQTEVKAAAEMAL